MDPSNLRFAAGIPPRGGGAVPGHRRAQSETFLRLPDDVLFDSDPDFGISDIDFPSLSDDASASGGGGPAAVTVFSFAGPRVGNQKFRERFEELGVKTLRVRNVHDEVPKVPGFFINENAPDLVRKLVDWLPWSYFHVGVELALDHKKSPYIKGDVFDVAAFHNLEALLHLLDGFHGKDKEFELVTERDPALVNKTADFLQEEHLVPPHWRQDLNKGMIRAEGKWVLQDRPTLDDHPHDMNVHLEKLGLHKGQSV